MVPSSAVRGQNCSRAGDTCPSPIPTPLLGRWAWLFAAGVPPSALSAPTLAHLHPLPGSVSDPDYLPWDDGLKALFEKSALGVVSSP